MDPGLPVPEDAAPNEQLGEQTAGRITLRVYPGAHHAFDSFAPPSPYYGHSVGRHPEAAVQAEAEVKRFLVQHLAGLPPQADRGRHDAGPDDHRLRAT